MNEQLEPDTSQQQIARVTRVTPAPTQEVTETSQFPYENTPDFQQWKQQKLREAQAYLKDAWAMEVSVDKLVLRRDDMGYPDDIRRVAAHKQILGNQRYRSANGEEILGSYNTWRSLD